MAGVTEGGDVMQEIRVPDIGGATQVTVIEIAVAPGSVVSAEQPLITLESDKAAMEIPAPVAGTIHALHVRVGDTVEEGTLIATLLDDEVLPTPASATQTTLATEADAASPVVAVLSSSVITVTVPDIGTNAAVDVIAVEVAVGDQVAAEQTLVTLEGEKATIDIPAPQAGTVQQMSVAIGQKIKQGEAILQLQISTPTPTSVATAVNSPASAPTPMVAPVVSAAPAAPIASSGIYYAGPSVRRMARELGVDLGRVSGSAAKGRISKSDVQAYVKAHMLRVQSGNAVSGLALAETPQIDFSKFGEIEWQPLHKIKRLTASNLHRNWVTIPHVTQFDEADITALEAFRQQHKHEAERSGVKLTPLVFIMKAVVAGLQAFPQFNASLSPNGEQLILKKYFHVGVAIDTPNGLVVAVVRDVQQKSVLVLAQELAQLSTKARTKGLTPAEMQGGCFTISSLGGIGGTAFTPIVNWPEVAILGVSRAQQKPVYQDGAWVPRLLLPLSLSYDHRVIDGAEAARFSHFLVQQLTDVSLLVL